jgi:hypothetical protein
MEGRRRRSFTDDYKRQAVDLVASSGRIDRNRGLQKRHDAGVYCASGDAYSKSIGALHRDRRGDRGSHNAIGTVACDVSADSR